MHDGMAAPGGREQRFACHAHQSWSPSWLHGSWTRLLPPPPNGLTVCPSPRPNLIPASLSRNRPAGRPPGFEQIQTATALNLLPQSSSSPRGRGPCMPMHVAVRISPSAPPSPSVGRRRRKPSHSRRRVTFGTDL
ncbi:hypothetical protein PVAP13_2KG061500 [Panicum virgatum]|uniref:Uncharacterized protein n=1 Tax=Panicum virgatum TaxID=38727 RepID=A0A8T0W2S1_PANVG|nr:hypothetical protein PVAP13_2KG061500 [Panicum virgatum]